MDLWDLYVIITTQWGRGRETLELVRQALQGGATVIQLREKDWPGRRLVEVGQKIRELTWEAGALFIVNDRIDVALAVEADGAHVGQEDIPPSLARKILGKHKILGVSAGTVEEASEAWRDGADYLGVGSIFPTLTKKDAGEPIGLEGLRAIRRAVPLPLVAIGGIKQENVEEVIRAGADGVAVISAVLAAEDVKEAASRLLATVRRVKSELRGNRDGF
ncbi:MAG TPA: thiamine phosphate synthase [Moorella mulderi]|nr:thiamine phosphate synthase [Moorella mulderi]